MLNVVLYRPQIPQNTGNIARTCCVTNTKLHLIEKLGFSIDDKRVKRAGLDYWHLLNLEVHESLEHFLKKYGQKTIYPVSKFAKKAHSSVTYEDDVFLLFGMETKGLPEELMQRYSDNCVRIPMIENEAARSLNLSNAVNIVLYEALRQLDYLSLS